MYAPVAVDEISNTKVCFSVCSYRDLKRKGQLNGKNRAGIERMKADGNDDLASASCTRLLPNSRDFAYFSLERPFAIARPFIELSAF